MQITRPLLGFMLGLVIYLIFEISGLSSPLRAGLITLLCYPLMALQIKLPTRQTLTLALSLLIGLALLFGIVTYSLVKQSINHLNLDINLPVLAGQCLISLIIFFIFYCVAVEEGQLKFPYTSLFKESWLCLMKIILGAALAQLTWWLLVLIARGFSAYLNIDLFEKIIENHFVLLTTRPLLFGIAMNIFYQYEDLLEKFRNILLIFCRFLYPIFALFTLIFLLLIPFSTRSLNEFWQVILVINGFGIVLFNGVFQAGFTKSPYSKSISLILYASLILTAVYSLYVFRFPMKEILASGFNFTAFLLLLNLTLLTAYPVCYSLALAVSKTSWLSFVKGANTIIALVAAVLYLILALPLFNPLHG